MAFYKYIALLELEVVLEVLKLSLLVVKDEGVLQKVNIKIYLKSEGL